jgi:hypothetical protein
MRVRDLKPRDEKSIYDEIHHEGTQFFYGSIETIDRCVVKVKTDAKKIPKNLFYTKADVLEDEVLFPEEYSSDTVEPSDIAKFEPLRVWEREGFSVRRFVEGYESDSTLDTIESADFDDEDEYEEDEDEDMDETYESNDESNGDDQTPAIADRNRETPNGIPAIIKEVLNMALSAPESEPDMETEFWQFLDKEKATSMCALLTTCDSVKLTLL